MEGGPGSMEYWRDFFSGAGADIFEVVERAILVAALYWPEELRRRRDRIAEKLYTCHLTSRTAAEEEEEEMNRGGGGAGEKGSKVGSNGGRSEEVERMVSNCSYDVAEALTEEIEEESQLVGEVLRIKEVICVKDESDNVLFESLRRLQLMRLSVDTLKATEIGKAVNGLRKHSSKQIRHLVRTLIDGWKVLVDDWVNATAAIADNSPDSMNPSSTIDDEEGLPSPPLDEGAFLATQTANIQLSEIFDGMDDDGNIRNIGEHNMKQDNGRRHKENHKPVKAQQPQRQRDMSENNGHTRIQEPFVRQPEQQESINRQAWPRGTMQNQSRLLDGDSDPGRPEKQSYEQRPTGVTKSLQQGHSGIQRKPSTVVNDKSKHTEEVSVQARIEVAKRKLQERYQEAADAKKQRTIQVMELHDIPKQAHNHWHPFQKPKNNIRSWANAQH